MRTLPLCLPPPSSKSLALVLVRRKERFILSLVFVSLDLPSVHTKHSACISKPGDTQCDSCHHPSKAD